MVNAEIFGQSVNVISGVGKRKIRELFINGTHNVKLSIRIDIMKQQRGNKTDIAVAPDADFIFSCVRNFAESCYRMGANADKLSKGGNGKIHRIGYRNKPFGNGSNIVLHKAVVSASSEKA